MEIAVNNVSKAYKGGVWGLKSFSLTLRDGVLGLLGPNGAGKTTLMNILATITKPTEGSVSWNGIDIAKNPDELRRVLGYLPQDFGIYPNLTAVEFLQYMAAIKGLDSKRARRRIDDLLALVDLTHVRHRPLGGFSGGMKQRVGIALALGVWTNGRRMFEVVYLILWYISIQGAQPHSILEERPARRYPRAYRFIISAVLLY